MTVKDLGEDGLIERLVAQLKQGNTVEVGPGDDCAVLAGGVLLKTDCVVEGVHFLPQEDGERVGWKAVARVVSDFVAMGGRPEAMLITLALEESSYTVEWLEALYRGMQRCASVYDFSIVGGETSKLPVGLMISVAGMGKVIGAEAVLRSTGQEGDAVMVTGNLGGSMEGWHLDFQPRMENMRWLVTHYNPTSMMDISDGLGKDLPRLAKASGLSYELDYSKVPCHHGVLVQQAIEDGEDYELLFTLPRDQADQLMRDKSWLNLPAGFTKIGSLCLKGDEGLSGGWEHF